MRTYGSEQEKKEETVSITRPPFRVGFRKRSTTTQPSTYTTYDAGSPTATSTPSSRVTKPTRRKVLPSRISTTSKPVESQVTSTNQAASRFTNRFKSTTRKPFFKTSTPKRTIFNTTDLTLESTNQQSLEDNSTMSTEAAVSFNITTTAQTVQQAQIPQAKPSRKRPQILRINSQYKTRTTRRPLITTELSTRTTNVPVKTTSSAPTKYTNKKTVAITTPYLRGSYSVSQTGLYNTPQTVTADQFVPNFLTAKEVHGSSQIITAQDFINNYPQSTQTSPRSNIRHSTTEIPLVIITPGRTVATRRRKPTPQAFDKILPGVEVKHTYKPDADYDYYDNIEASILGNGKIPEHSKVLLHSNGIIECLDQGNFPHPVSCKKFISCAKMDNDKIIGWEYTCPKNLSFDPIGGMCNWSAGLGCNEA